MKQVERDVLPLLTPIAVGPSAPFPHMPSLSLNVGVVGDEHDARLRTPGRLRSTR
jgi:polyphosphate kinase